jgi:excinuclease ABC subunit C
VHDRLQAQLRSLPRDPGVYLFRDEGGDVLYIGKAKSLRTRVRSYFQRGGDGRVATAQLPERVRDVEVIVTGSEVEALHLEQNLVKRHRPPFNVRLRDDKSFPYIAVTAEDEYPRVMFTRERHRRGVLYFGPYASAKKVRETLDVLNRAFRFRPCEGPKPGRHSGVPCLDFHIERCYAPCVGAISREQYGEIIDGVVEFLSGHTDPIQRQLERKMREAAADERFEEAARYRNRLFAVRHLVERQAADRRSVGTADVIGIAADGDRAAVQVFPLRDGRLIDRYGFQLENLDARDEGGLLEAFCVEYYGSGPTIPPLIVVPPASGDTSTLAAFLSELRGSRVELRVPLRGDKRRLQQLASENARLALAADTLRSETRRRWRVQALEELREALNLESLPMRIECFDVSNLQEAAPVASMVVFEDAQARKAHYRKFAIRGLAGQDDFAAMEEAIARRFARLGSQPAGVATADGNGSFDESFAATPNLVVVDGGKGQLGAALAAIQRQDLARVAVISLAKREEEVFVPGQPQAVRLDRHSPGLQLLQRIRDEAHRFAVGYHRQRRSGESFASIFDELRGVGEARRRAILRHFGSPGRFLAASQEELEAVPGLPAKTARQVYAQLHKAGRA